MKQYSNNVILTATGINKYFYSPERFQVLNNVNFEINQGDFVSILGKTGCGKSTLLHLLSTLDNDYEGEISIDGQLLKDKSLTELSSFRGRHIGLVFQFHYLLPEFTILENVMIPALKYGLKTREEIRLDAMEKLRIMEIGYIADKQPGEVSGGFRQRAAMARALINNPLLLICDEPTGDLDAANTHFVCDVLKHLAEDYDQTIITVTRDKELTENCNHIIEMQDGKIAGSYSTAEKVYV